MPIRSLNFTILSRKIFRDFNYKFIFYGFYNVFISNLVLQILLLYLTSFQATFISQVVNFLLGYYLYGNTDADIDIDIAIDRYRMYGQ